LAHCGQYIDKFSLIELDRINGKTLYANPEKKDSQRLASATNCKITNSAIREGRALQSGDFLLVSAFPPDAARALLVSPACWSCYQ
jgi:hypothetical protein